MDQISLIKIGDILKYKEEYIGSNGEKTEMWLFDENSNQFIKKEIDSCSILKIFDDFLSKFILFFLFLSII